MTPQHELLKMQFQLWITRANFWALHGDQPRFEESMSIAQGYLEAFERQAVCAP